MGLSDNLSDCLGYPPPHAKFFFKIVRVRGILDTLSDCPGDQQIFQIVWVRGISDTLSNCPGYPAPPAKFFFQIVRVWGISDTLLTGALVDWDKCCPAYVRCPRLIVYLKV